MHSCLRENKLYDYVVGHSNKEAIAGYCKATKTSNWMDTELKKVLSSGNLFATGGNVIGKNTQTADIQSGKGQSG